MTCLVITVRFHDARYHGQPDWPASPARLFQALIAGAAQGDELAAQDREALAWLESLDAPIIAAPATRPGQAFVNYVPNNDLDKVDGDPARIGKIRAPKPIRPILLDTKTPLLYVWTFAPTTEAKTQAARIAVISESLYQLGRGVDMAWASGEVIDDKSAKAQCALHKGALHWPAGVVGDTILAVPLPGSLDSLIERYDRSRKRFQKTGAKSNTAGDEAASGIVFVQPPRPRFRQVAYDSPPVHLLFDLVRQRQTTFWPRDRIVALTERVRDAAAERLMLHQPPAEAEKRRRMVVGHCEADESDKTARLRITPLPSIGHSHADQAIRRILVEIPPNCPLRASDVEWAFCVMLTHNEDGEITCELAPARERGMLGHYGIENSGLARSWQTVTPAALPHTAARRRIDPVHRLAHAKNATQRAEEENRAAASVIHALRHAGITKRALRVQVQREPFSAVGARAEAFAPGTRFAKERLWHIHITFAEAIRGPLILGDGRYLGLGLMQPVAQAGPDVRIFSLPADIRITRADRADLLHAVRRALMALSRDAIGDVDPLFSGHEPDGAPAGSGQHRHIFLAAADLDDDGLIEQVMIAAPWVCDRSAPVSRHARDNFNEVTAGLQVVRAGRLGVVPLRMSSAASLQLCGPARSWVSHTEYRPTRHAGRRKDPGVALPGDVADECARRGLPRPSITVLDLKTGPRGGVSARLRLEFAAAVTGPILLGRDSHQGGGLFATA